MFRVPPSAWGVNFRLSAQQQFSLLEGSSPRPSLIPSQPSPLPPFRVSLKSFVKKELEGLLLWVFSLTGCTFSGVSIFASHTVGEPLHPCL